MRNALIGLALQLGLFTPFYLMWKSDCEEIGVGNLAVSLGTRFACWVVLFPFWTIGLMK